MVWLDGSSTTISPGSEAAPDASAAETSAVAGMKGRAGGAVVGVETAEAPGGGPVGVSTPGTVPETTARAGSIAVAGTTGCASITGDCGVVAAVCDAAPPGDAPEQPDATRSANAQTFGNRDKEPLLANGEMSNRHERPGTGDGSQHLGPRTRARGGPRRSGLVARCRHGEGNQDERG